MRGNVKNIMKNHGFSLDDVFFTPHKPKIGKLLVPIFIGTRQTYQFFNDLFG